MLLAPSRPDAGTPPSAPDSPATATHTATTAAPSDLPADALGRAAGAGAGLRPQLHAERSASMPPPQPDSLDSTDLCQRLVQQASLDESVRLLRDWLHEAGVGEARLGWWEHGHVRLSPLMAGFSPAMPPAAPPCDTDTARWTDAMEEALDQGQALGWPPAPADEGQWVTRAQQALASSQGGTRVLSLILPGSPQPLGALTLRCGSGPDIRPETWQALVSQIAPILAWQRLADRPWHWHLRQAVNRAWRRSRVGMRSHPRRAALALLLALALLGGLPLPERVGGSARIEGAQQRVLAATSDGFIKQVYAQPGDRVKAGEVLADLAQQDLKLEREKWASQAAQQDNAYAAAMTRADRAEAALALSRLEEAQAQLALIDEQLQRTQLKAPFDGVLIQGDLSQSVGAPVKQGETLMTVASTQRWRVIIEIDEGDIGHVRIGQSGAIALSALPWDTLPLRVQRITPLAQAKDGRNLFEVEAAFTAPVPPDVRPGLTGQARVRIGERPLLGSWLRPLAERLRLAWWSWWGG